MNEPRTIDMDKASGWGNSMFFMDWDKRRISGHMTPRPAIGDIVLSKMQSGKVARFELVEIELKRDPPDMFFATVKDLGYL